MRHAVPTCVPPNRELREDRQASISHQSEMERQRQAVFLRPIRRCDLMEEPIWRCYKVACTTWDRGGLDSLNQRMRQVVVAYDFLPARLGVPLVHTVGAVDFEVTTLARVGQIHIKAGLHYHLKVAQVPWSPVEVKPGCTGSHQTGIEFLARSTHPVNRCTPCLG